MDESRNEAPTLGQIIGLMTGGDRIKIIDGDNEKAPVLYTGFVGCMCKELGEKIPVENISDFKNSDLEEIIYTKIYLEVAG